MKYKSLGQWDIVRKNSRKERTSDGNGWRWVDDKDSQHKVELLIDTDKIIRNLGARATLTRSKKSVYMAGAVLVREII